MTNRLSKSPESFLPLTPVAFEILLALAEGERHGYEVMIEIERRSGAGSAPIPARCTGRSTGWCRKGC